MPEVIAFAPFVLVPAALIALLSAPARRWIFVLGIALSLGIELAFMQSPENHLFIVTLVGIGVSAGALLVELIAWSVRTHKRLVATSSSSSD